MSPGAAPLTLVFSLSADQHSQPFANKVKHEVDEARHTGSEAPPYAGWRVPSLRAKARWEPK